MVHGEYKSVVVVVVLAEKETREKEVLREEKKWLKDFRRVFRCMGREIYTVTLLCRKRESKKGDDYDDDNDELCVTTTREKR